MEKLTPQRLQIAQLWYENHCLAQFKVIFLSL